ncbi:hypothetical protein HN51_005449 [Arachis hypogaea]
MKSKVEKGGLWCSLNHWTVPHEFLCHSQHLRVSFHIVFLAIRRQRHFHLTTIAIKGFILRSRELCFHTRNEALSSGG